MHGRRWRSCAWAFAILAATWVFVPGAARADAIVLRNGESIEGSIVDATRNTVIIRRAIGGMRQMRIQDIAEVRLDLAQGEQIAGRLMGWVDGVHEVHSGGEVVRIGAGRILTRERRDEATMPPPPSLPQPPLAPRPGEAPKVQAATPAAPAPEAERAERTNARAAAAEIPPVTDGATIAAAKVAEAEDTAASRRTVVRPTRLAVAAAPVVDGRAVVRPAPIAAAVTPVRDGRAGVGVAGIAAAEVRAAAVTPAAGAIPKPAPAVVAPAAAATAGDDASEVAGAETSPAEDDPAKAVVAALPPAEASAPGAAARPEAEQDGQPLAVKGMVDPAEAGADGIVFRFELSRPAEQPVVLIYGTVDGTAIAGQDYEPQQGVVTLTPGSRSADVRVPLIEDRRARVTGFELFLTADPKVATVIDQRISATIPAAD